MLGEISENGKIPNGEPSNFSIFPGIFKWHWIWDGLWMKSFFLIPIIHECFNLKLSVIKPKRHSSHYSDEWMNEKKRMTCENAKSAKIIFMEWPIFPFCFLFLKWWKMLSHQASILACIEMTVLDEICQKTVFTWCRKKSRKFFTWSLYLTLWQECQQ